MMERSLINSLRNNNSSLYSSLNANQSNLIPNRSPTKDQQNIYLHKSRIQHLPGDHREDLSSKLDFVVVFQAIQISRLSEQITFLRCRLRENESSFLNTNNYEIQIRELMDRCNKLQNQKFSYSQQLQQTKDASQNIFAQLELLKNRYAQVDFCTSQKYKLQKARNEELCIEIQKWKTRYNNLDKNKSEEIQGYKRMLDAQKQNITNRDTKSMMTRYENEKEQLMGKLRDRKQQLDEKDLEMKKVMNYYEQAQVRLKQYEAKIEDYEQKVAMLSQQTYRLSQMLRIKQQELKNLKINIQNDLSLRMSQITSLDQTKHHLNHKVRQYQQQNQSLRNYNLQLQQDILTLKQKISQKDRLQHQIYENKNEISNKMKVIERKDRKIQSLQNDLKQQKQIQSQLKIFKEMCHKFKENIIHIQSTLNAKIMELQKIKQKQSQLISQSQSYQHLLRKKQAQFQSCYKTITSKYASLTNNNLQIQQTNKLKQLKVQQFALQLKEKQYKIDELKNEIRQFQVKLDNANQQKMIIRRQMQGVMLMERKDSQIRFQKLQMGYKMASKEKDYIRNQMQTRNRNFQESIQRLQVRCQDLQYQKRELTNIITQYQHKNNYLQKQLVIKDQQILQTKHFASIFTLFKREFEGKFNMAINDLKSLQRRFETVQNIIVSLKAKVMNRFKDFEGLELKARRIEMKYEELFQWFIRMNRSMQQNGDSSFDSPSKSYLPSVSFFDNTSNKRDMMVGSNSPRSPRIQRFNQNINNANKQNQQIPIAFLLKHVLICAEVQQLRKRIGDKNAKVESMRHSIAKKSEISHTNTKNGFSTSSNGFSTSRQQSSGHRNIYY